MVPLRLTGVGPSRLHMGNWVMHVPSAERQLAADALRARVATMSEDERQAWAAGTSVAAVQAERARQARLVSDGAAGARAAAGRIAREWGSGVGEKNERPANAGKGRRETYASDRGARRRRNDSLSTK